MSSVSVYVSQSDLEELLPQLLAEHGVEALLYHVWGFDNNITLDGGRFYEEMICQHRNRQGRVVECARYVGIERTDKAWLQSGSASEELLLMLRNDKELEEDLKNLSKRRIS